VCTFADERGRFEITASHITKLLRESCTLHNGATKYGVAPSEISTRSIRSGAVMALAMQGRHSEKDIMMIGRWKSDTFMEYVRPQVLEWSGHTSKIMAEPISFVDLGQRGAKKDPPTPRPNNQRRVTPRK